MDAPGSEAQKRAWLERRLAPWTDRMTPLQAVRGEARWSYRDKVCLSACWRDGEWRFGLMARDRRAPRGRAPVREELIPIPECPVHSTRVRAMTRLLSEILPPPDRFPLAFYLQSGAQATLVLKSAAAPDTDWVASATVRLGALGLEGLWLHLYPCAGRHVFAKRGWHLLWGTPRSADEWGLRYGPTAFQQLIPRLYRQALEQAESFLWPLPGDAVVDLYCGTGATLRRWQERGALAMGVELGAEAVECARHNAPSAQVLRGACRERMPQVDAWLRGHTGRRLLYMNPPRTGVEPEVLAWIAADLRPERIAYLSCSAGTLRRDLDGLLGYRVEQITPYDFFPNTHHVETLVLLARSAD
jgi:23S rRNA (uracil1939-C5)-methyltransferase